MRALGGAHDRLLEMGSRGEVIDDAVSSQSLELLELDEEPELEELALEESDEVSELDDEPVDSDEEVDELDDPLPLEPWSFL